MPRQPEEPAAKRPTSHDVAARAGVSQATVSLVLSGKAAGRASPAVQQRVRRTASELGYRPHRPAQALRSGTAQAVGLVVPDVTAPFVARVLRGAQGAGRPDDYAVALIEPGRDAAWQLESMEAVGAATVDGWLLFALEPPAVGDALGPIVLVEGKGQGYPSVVLDVVGGADAALRHLLGLGHRRIGHLAVDIPVWTFEQRGARWEAALHEVGVGPEPGLRVRTAFVLPEARAAARELLTTARPTAVFCDDDLLAAGAYLAAADLGLEIPHDLSVTGFAGTQPGEVVLPALTTVVAPAERLGEVAMTVLVDAIRGRPVEDLTVLDVELRVADSTASPRSHAGD